MPKPKLHLDVDASQKALLEALLKCGMMSPVRRHPACHSRRMMITNCSGQLPRAGSFLRIIFATLSTKPNNNPHHSGILLAHRSSYSLADLIRLIDRLLATTSVEEWIGQVRRLSDWNE